MSYQMVVYAQERPTSEHARCSNDPTFSEKVRLVPGREYGERGWQDIAFYGRQLLSADRNKVVHTISVCQCTLNSRIMCFSLQGNMTSGIQNEMVVQSQQ